MTYENIRFDVEGPLAFLTVDRPKALHALNARCLQEMEQALRTTAENRDLRVLIVTGAGEKAFVAGADIAGMLELAPEQAREFSELGHRVFSALEALRIPTIAAVNGFAL